MGGIPDGGAGGRAGGSSGTAWWLLPPLLAGAGLRLWRIHAQVLGGDEYHAVKAALQLEFPAILSTYLPSDHCIPLTALYRLWLLSGQPLTELVLRMPLLLAGLILLAAAPRFVERRLGRSTAVPYAWLLALSPPLVLYGRIARSYILLVLLGALALGAFIRWWEGGGARWAAAIAGWSALALYTHLGAGPFLVAPFLWGGARKLAEARRNRSARRQGAAAGRSLQPSWVAWLLTGATAATAMAAPLILSWSSLGQLISQKRMELVIGGDTLFQVLLLAAGARSPWAALAFWGLALVGLWQFLSRCPALGWFTVTAVCVQILGIRALSPEGLSHPLILHRYLLIALPLVLLWAAYGLAELSSRFFHRRRSCRLLGGAGLGLLFAAWVIQGPLGRPAFLRGSFAHHNLFMLYSEKPPQLRPQRVPEAYELLARWPEGGAILEAPWPLAWTYNLEVPLAQLIHGREVIVALNLRPGHPRDLRFRNAVHNLKPQALLESRARFLVLHLDPPAEEMAIPDKGWIGRQRPPPNIIRNSLREAQSLARRLPRVWGPPKFADPVVMVWDLQEVRSRLRPGTPAAGGR